MLTQKSPLMALKRLLKLMKSLKPLTMPLSLILTM